MKYFLKTLALAILVSIISLSSYGQFTHQDTLRGTITPERAWWDVVKYDIKVTPDLNQKTITGSVVISYKVVNYKNQRTMQIDLQQPMNIDSIYYRWGQAGTKSKDKEQSITNYNRNGNVYLVTLSTNYTKNDVIDSIKIVFSGKPRSAVNPPWDGGWVWKKDDKGRPWVTVACQGLGASVWYPCKDHQSDEPDNGASLTITVPDSLVAVGNGRLKNKTPNNNGTTTWKWEVTNPINNYNIIPYIGKYVNWQEKYIGEKGDLDCSYWVLDYNLEKAKTQFGRDVTPMLRCFEGWFGPYPFYEDSYKLVETPHLGMEHQSAVAYGNKFKNGYLGMDLSGSGWGKNWDYIIVHESGHEWFANNITSRDIADMWVHEGFTDYSEVLFVECQYGKKAADEYCQGLRRNIENDRPIIGAYGVNKEGSGDMYAKGANMLHTIRQVINNEDKFRQILRGLNKEYYHKVVDTKEVEAYMSKQSGKDLSKIFDQYLRTTQIPVLEYKIEGNKLSYRWTSCIKDFNMPVRVFTGTTEKWIQPTENWATQTIGEGDVAIDKNFYITAKKL